MTSKKLRDVKISEEFITADSIAQAIDSIDLRLSDMNIDPKTIFELAQVLQFIINRFKVANFMEVSMPEGGWLLIA